MNSEFAAYIPVKPSAGSKAKKNYTSANGGKIPNLGERVVKFQTMEGATKKIRFQAAPVKRTLVSVAKLVEAGNEVKLEKKNPRIVNEATGEITYLKYRNGMFILQMWVKNEQTASGFTRQVRR